MTRLFYQWRHVESGTVGEKHQDFPTKRHALDALIKWNRDERWIYSPIRTEQV
jgi:hypothetical protein